MAIDALTERQYVFSDRYPARTQVYEQIAQASARARNEATVQRDLTYGSHPRQRLDLFAGSEGRPLVVFVHGGYWRSQDKDSYSFVATELLRHGLSVAVVGYPLAPAVPVAGIVESLREAMRWLRGPGARLLPRTEGLVVAGHSAGGHLAASLACDRQLGPSISGCLALSGLFDLRPLVRTSIGQSVGLDADTAVRLSPADTNPGPGWLLAAVGSEETPAFHAQAHGYAEHWRSAGRQADTLTVPGADHYSIVLQLALPDGPVMQALLARLGSVEVLP